MLELTQISGHTLAYELNMMQEEHHIPLFPLLAAASLQSAAMPKTNQRVEGGFVMASMAYRCYRRNQGPALNSDTIRKKNAENLGVMHVVQSQKSLRTGSFCASVVSGKFQ
jgi:hypothetical protein